MMAPALQGNRPLAHSGTPPDGRAGRALRAWRSQRYAVSFPSNFARKRKKGDCLLASNSAVICTLPSSLSTNCVSGTLPPLTPPASSGSASTPSTGGLEGCDGLKSRPGGSTASFYRIPRANTLATRRIESLCLLFRLCVRICSTDRPARRLLASSYAISVTRLRAVEPLPSKSLRISQGTCLLVNCFNCHRQDCRNGICRTPAISFGFCFRDETT